MNLLGRRNNFLGNDNLTVLLLHMDGANAGVVFPDSSRSNHTITAVGDAQTSTAQKVFGTASLLLDGTLDKLTTPINSDFHFGTGNFTVDGRFRLSANTDARTLFDFHQAGTDYIVLDWTATGTILSFRVSVGGVAKADYSVSWNPSLNTWYHIAVVRNGTALAIYVDGTALSLTENTAISTNDIGVDDGGAVDTFYIGSFYTANLLSGYIDEFRVSKGVARWTGNFTSPLIAYR